MHFYSNAINTSFLEALCKMTWLSQVKAFRGEGDFMIEEFIFYMNNRL